MKLLHTRYFFADGEEAERPVLPLPRRQQEPTAAVEADDGGGRVGQPPHRALPQRPVPRRDRDHQAARQAKRERQPSAADTSVPHYVKTPWH